MGLFDVFKGKPEIKGHLGYFELGDWWLVTFSKEDREYIDKNYEPLTIGISADTNSKPLTQGSSDISSSASDFLMGLASFFSKPENYHIGLRIIDKAVELAGSDILDLHFAYLEKIRICYRSRDEHSDALGLAITACESQIDIAPKAAKAFQTEYPNEPLPEHTGYKQLTIIRANEENYKEAIRLSELAKMQTWAGDWDKRISRYENKLKK